MGHDGAKAKMPARRYALLLFLIPDNQQIIMLNKNRLDLRQI